MHIHIYLLLAVVMSPKSNALPVDEIVIKSIIFDTPGSLPPKNNPRIELDAAPKFLLASVKLPKSIASPVDAIVTYSISLLYVGVRPPQIRPLVEFETPVP